MDPDYEQAERAYKAISREILGVEEDDEEEGGCVRGLLGVWEGGW